MPFIETNGRRIMFIHIPKTGGTSVEQWMSCYGKLRLKSSGRPNALKTTPQHLTWSDITEIFGHGYFDDTFTIVRNPYSRIESAYKMRYILGNSPLFPTVPSFSIWLHTHLERWHADPWHLDNHLRPQWCFIGSNVRVFKLEDGLNAAIEAVAARNGLEPTDALPHAMSSTGFKGEVTWDDVQVDMVRDAYKRDFERFGYDPDAVPTPTRHVSLLEGTPEERIERIGPRAFVGGTDPEAWYGIGRLQFHFLVAQGLMPGDVFLDVACGSLRLGQFLIPYLSRGNYQGLEITRQLVELGLGQEISAELVAMKAPRFVFNADFSTEGLAPFDYAIAQSLFTHLDADDIRRCFSSLRKAAKLGSRFFFTYFSGNSAANPASSDPHLNFRYSISELSSLAYPSEWRIEKIGDWGHPRDQQMAVATAVS